MAKRPKHTTAFVGDHRSVAGVAIVLLLFLGIGVPVLGYTRNNTHTPKHTHTHAYTHKYTHTHTHAYTHTNSGVAWCSTDGAAPWAAGSPVAMCAANVKRRAKAKMRVKKKRRRF